MIKLYDKVLVTKKINMEMLLRLMMITEQSHQFI